MNKQLYLLRHAKSDWSAPSSDYERPLNARGQRQSVLIGQWMQANKLIPDCIISSPALRARETSMNICEEINFNVIDVYWEEDLYHANHYVLLAESIKFLARYDKVMLVAHNPGMDDFLEYLCAGSGLNYTAAGKLMTTATLAQIELPADIDEIGFQAGRLLKLIRPADLQ